MRKSQMHIMTQHSRGARHPAAMVQSGLHHVFGLKVENERKLAGLRRALETALDMAERPGVGGRR